MPKFKNIEVYWFNGLDTKVSFFNDTLDEANFMGSIEGNTPIKLSVDIQEHTNLVIKQVSHDKILISSVSMALAEDVTENG